MKYFACVVSLSSNFSTQNLDSKENSSSCIKFAETCRAGGKWAKEDFRKYLPIFIFMFD